MEVTDKVEAVDTAKESEAGTIAAENVIESVSNESNSEFTLTLWGQSTLKGLQTKEQEALKVLRMVYQNKKPRLAEDVETLLRFLVARSFSVGDAEIMLDNHLKWRKENFPIKRKSFLEEPFVKNGASYHHGYDKDGAPIFVVRSCLFTPRDRDINACVKYCIFMVTHMRNLYPKSGRFMIIWDRESFSLRKNLDLDLVKKLGKELSDNFPETLSKALICPTGPVLKGIWKVAQHFFDPRTKEKFSFLGSKKYYLKHIHEEQLEERYGGASKFLYQFQPEHLPEEIGDPDPWK